MSTNVEQSSSKIAIIVGSHRENSQSAKIGRFIQAQLEKLRQEIYLLDLWQNPLPLFNNTDAQKSDFASGVGQQLKTCSGLIVITPEWNGMVTPGLKNFFQFTTKDQVGFKPALIVSVSSGAGGAYPIVELRSSSYKNNRINYLPEHLIFRNVEKILNSPVSANEDIVHSQLMERRTVLALNILLEFVKTYQKLDKSKLFDHEDFRNGM